MDIGGIYNIVNLVNGKRYVGYTENLRHRKSQHKSSAKRLDINNYHLLAAYKKYGIENFKFEILEECEPESLVVREDYWTTKLGSHLRTHGYNIKPTGTKSAHAIESRIKMSLKNKGRIKSEAERRNISKALKGRKLTKEWIEKMVSSRKGYKHSEDAKSKISKGNSGKIRTEECRRSISIRQKGGKHSEEHKRKISENSASSKPVIQYSLNNEIITQYNSMAAAKRALGKTSLRIKDCCLGENGVKQSGGFIWKFKN
jgi:group I intron endonuclease